MAEDLSILNDPPAVLEGPQLLHELISWEENADACALDFTKNDRRQHYTYREFQSCYKSLVDRILESLVKQHAQNDGPLEQHIVPLLIPQSPGLYISQLAILNSGGAFCPLNLDSPVERLKFNVSDVKAKFVITTSDFQDAFSWEDGPEVILVDEFPQTKKDASTITRPLPREVSPEDLAYVMYTSGSSGTPKGVAVSHLAASQSLLAHELFLPKFERFLQFAAPSFDVSVFEIFFPLKRGKTLVGCDKTQLMNDLPGIITQLEIDAAELTPGVAGSLLEKRSHAPGLKLLLTIGEMLTTPVVEEFGGSETQENILYGMYGPTEAAIHCTVYPEMEANAKPGNIGVPFATVSTFIAVPSTSIEDAANLQFLPIGELGELVVGGPQVARGYLNREEQNKAAFVHFEGRNYYRTGDKARQLPNGTIEILGRISSGQVKLRGQRLELGEVEEAVYKHSGVKTAIAAVIDKSLVVYTLVRDGNVQSNELIDTCAKWLPKYMIPSEIIILENFPYLPSGKIDKRKLNSDYQDTKKIKETEETISLTDTQVIVKKVLDDVLGSFRPTLRLAAAGLDSLLAIRVSSKLRLMGFNINTIAVLQAENLEALAKLCEDSKSATPSEVSKVLVSSTETVLLALNGNVKDMETTMKCTPLQSAMLAETSKDPRAYRNWVELELVNITDVDQVTKSLELLSTSNPILRTGFMEARDLDGWVQIVWNKSSVIDVEEVETLKYTFDPAKDTSFHRPIRFQLLRLPSSTKILVHIHHALYDAWSLELLLDDLDMLLGGKPLLQRPSFRAIVDNCFDGTHESDNWLFKDYWKDHLQDLEIRALPNFHPGNIPSPELAIVHRRTSILTSEVEVAARALSVSPHTIFQAAYCLVLGSYLGATDLCFGSVFSGRTLPINGIEDIAGPCLATLPIRVDTAVAKSLGELVQELNLTNRKHLEHSALPLKNIKSAAGVYPGQQLFDSLIIWQQTLHSHGHHREFVNLVDAVDNLEFNLTLEVTPGMEYIDLKANYQCALFPEKQISTFLQQLEALARLVVENPSTDIKCCFNQFHSTLMSTENENPQISLKSSTLSSPVERIAAEDPNRPAIDFLRCVDEDKVDVDRMSYLELNIRSNQIGGYLLEQKVLPDELVCICMEKCVDLYAAILAVTKVGAGYLPQTPEVPSDRLRHILQESGVKLVLAQSSSRPLLKTFSWLRVVYLDEVDFGIFSKDNITPRSSPEHLSYCVYTSGSTGTPKGVLVTQGNLISNLDVLEDLYPIPKETRLLQQCSQAFDVSVFEIFFTWRVGGCLCSAIKDVLFRDMESAIRSLNVTHLSMTPSVAALLDPESIPNVGFLVTAGEAVTPKVKNAWAERGLWQGYGPSETTNICTVKPNVTHKDAINIIGPPLRNTSAFVLSPETEFSLVPLGGEGEFVFGGAQVFRGYMDKTKEIGKIIDHPVHGRLYRSGDFGRMLSDGSLAFTCRKDDQVKIRGQRVELGEINNTMLQSHFVRDCVTMIIDDDCGQRLVCFWAAAGDAAQDLKPLHPEQPIISELYKRLESTLPPYMVPSALIPMSRLPSTVQGKIDKRYLMSTFHKLEVDYLDLASQARKPLTDHVFTPLETEIANAVAMVTKLRVEDIQAETSFFSLGLDSISAISLSRILRQTYKQKVEISDVLKSPSVSRLAERISSRDIGLGSVTEIVGRPLDFEFDDGFREMITERFMESNKRVEAIYPCTPLQEAMLSAGESSSLQLYDNQVIFNVNGDVNKLKGCWREMVQRHEILRTCFLATDMPRFPFVQVVLEQHEILFTPTSEKVDDAGKTEPPYAINLTENNGISKLIVSMHHALYDGVALSVLYEEIETLYNDQLLPPPVSFAPFLKSMLSIDTDQCDKFWEVIMRNCKTSKFTSLHEISEDDQPQCHKSQAIAQYSLSWVEESVRSNETSLLAVCHTAWACILAELHQDSDVCFGNVVSGRVASVDGIERLVAPCFNTIPVRLSQLDRLSYIEAFRKFQCLNADSLPFQLAPLRRIQSKFSPDGSRLFDSLLILQQPVASRNSSIWSIENDSGAMDIPLVCEIVPNPVDDTLEIILHSYTSYFSRDTISDIMRMVQDKIQYALQNPRRQILSTILKEKIVTKTDSQRNANSAATIDNPIEALSMEEETLREAISTFTDVPAKNITRDISFFRLGLDSISIVQVASRLRKLGHKVKASDILERPSIGQLNAFLSISQKDPGTSTNNFDFERFDNQYRQVICSKANIDSEDIEAVRPCTYVQQGMLATTLHSGGHDYMNATWFDILPEILIESLRDAWQTVSENHEMLRTGFVSVDDPEFSFAMITFKKGKRQLPWYDAGNQRSISQDLLQEPWGLTLYTIDDKNVLCLRAHHAIYDAQSMQMVLSDVAKVYASKSTPPSRPLINTFLSEILKSSQDEQAEKEIFWKSSESRIAINRFPDLNPLHVEDTTSSVQEVVCQASKDEIEADCRANGVTMQAATQAAWARLLAAYIGENSTTFGLTLSGRSVHEDGDRVCFPSIVTLPARCDIFGTNAELLSRTMAYNAALHKHQFTPLTTIQKWAGYPAGKIFDTLFAYQKLPDIEEEVEMPWVISKEEASVDYAISMEVQPLKCGRVILRLTFRQDVIPQEQAKLLLQQYDTLLLDILKNPEASCEIAPQICKELLSVTPALEDVLPGPVQLLHDFVTFRALNSPEKFALEFATSLELGNFKSQKWTYRQLDEISNQVANFILQYGLVSGDIVAICFDKCPEASMAIIGILKAGCAYVALDPTAPDERSKFIVEDSAAKLILTRSKLMENLASYMTVDIFALDSQNILDGSSMEAPILKRNILPDDTSYCLYTSGTTGTPKGCLITHDNAVQFMLAFSRIFEGHWDDDSKYLQFASFHFDVSVMEQFWSWSVGICVASAPRDLIFEDITGAIQQLGITHIDLTPSLARLVHPDDVPSLRKGAFITGGEQLKQEILDDWGKYACIYNGYGPTEATIGCTMYPRVPINGKPSNIGPAYVNVGSFVLTPGTELPVLRGGIGELCVSGKLVGNGYLNRPDLTAERFPTLKEFNKRIYRTGDLVRILHDGSFIFLGRADDQVKLRGQRLELSEINQVIRNSMQDIQDVVTLVLKHTAQQKEQLVTFFVLPLKSAAVEVGNVIPTMREACKSRLPGYMVPTHFIPIEAIPLSPNNKADSKQLKLTYDSLSVEYLQTLSQSGQGDKQWTEHEQGIVNIIATALRAEVASVTRSSSVFELGLDSISIISFSRALQDAGLENAKLSIVRNNSSIGALVRALLDVDTFDQSRQNAKVAISQEIAAFSQKHIIMLCKELGISSAAVEGIYPCTPVQEGMIYRFLESDQPLYFNKFEFLLHDSIDTEKLFNAWGSVVAHLDILRTSFVATDDGFAQVVKTHVSNSLSNTLIDYHKSQKSIALQHPYSVRIESVGNSKSFILHIFHGLYDGNSLTMMLRRVIEEYKGLDMIDYGPPFMLSLSHGPLLKSSGAEKFWQTHLQGWSYHPMPQNLSVSGDIVSTNVLTNLAGFETLRKQLGVTPQAIIQAVWISVLQTIISPNLTIGIVTSGRTIDFENADKVIGPLFNTVPFHIEVESSFASAALVEKCHQFNMQLLEFQHTPLKDIQRFGPSRPGQQLFDTLFVFQRPEAEDEDLSNGFWTQIDNGQEADYPLAFEASLSPDSTKLSLTIVAQGSSITETQASELLDQVKEGLLSMIETSGQNLVLCNGFIPNGDDKNVRVDDMFIPPTSEQPFTWSEKTQDIRDEISILANIDGSSVSENSSIFELGLDSIDVIKLASRLKKKGIEISVSAIIKSQTIAKMAKNISNEGVAKITNTGETLSQMSSEIEKYLERMGRLPRNIQSVLPATPLQQSMVNEMIKSNYERYFNVDGFKLNDNVDLERLLIAAKEVVAESAILRTTFVEVEDPKLLVSYAQIVHNQLPQFQEEVTISTLPEGQSFQSFMEHFKHVAICNAKQRQELLQLQAVSTGASKYLIIAISHALYDGTSLRHIHEDIQRAYEGLLSPRPDFMPYLQEVFQSTTNDAKNFWRTTLSNLPKAQFPKKTPSQIKGPDESTRVERKSRVALKDIETLCKSSRITLQTLGQTCWALVLSHLMGQLEVVFGSVLSCRDSEVSNEVMFPLMNTVAVRSVLHGTLKDMLRYMQDISDTTRQYQHFPLGTAQAYALASRQDNSLTSDTTLFDSLFIYQGRRSTSETASLYQSVYGISDVEFPVCVEMEIEDDSCLVWTTKCKSSALDAAETENVIDALEIVLEQIVSASHDQVIISSSEGISVCGLPKFKIIESQPKTISSPAMSTSDDWSQTELDIRKALHQISQFPEDQILKDTTIFHLGLDSILILKLPALLKQYGIKLSVSTILKDQMIWAMARSAQNSASLKKETLNIEAVLTDSISELDLSSTISDLTKEVGEIQYVMLATAGQTYMVRQWQATQGAMFYHTFTYEFLGQVDKPKLEAAWNQLLGRHEILRCGFIDTGTKIVQVVFKNPSNSVFYHSSTESPNTWKQNSDLKYPALNLEVEDTESSRVRVKLVLHHVLYDGISLPILIDELQALYHEQQVGPVFESFQNFVAHSISLSSSAKDRWTTYLHQETLYPNKGFQNLHAKNRTQVFHPSNKVHGVKQLAQESGVSVDALFLAAVAKVLAQDIQNNEKSTLPTHIIFGVYLANRAPFGKDLSQLAAPTLNLLPICVKSPLERNIPELAGDIQRDLQMISSPEMVSASLADIYEWTGVRVNIFVNILKSSNPGLDETLNQVARVGSWKAVQDLGERVDVVEEMINDKVVVPSDRRCEAYLPTMDIEMRLQGDIVDIGIFAPVEMQNIDGAEGIIQSFLGFWH